MPKLITDLADLSTKATKAKTKGTGLVDERNAAFKVMDADMDELKLYLQGIINTIANTVFARSCRSCCKKRYGKC